MNEPSVSQVKNRFVAGVTGLGKGEGKLTKSETQTRPIRIFTASFVRWQHHRATLDVLLQPLRAEEETLVPFFVLLLKVSYSNRFHIFIFHP